jgi:hypothetical protein
MYSAYILAGWQMSHNWLDSELVGLLAVSIVVACATMWTAQEAPISGQYIGVLAAT